MKPQPHTNTLITQIYLDPPVYSSYLILISDIGYQWKSSYLVSSSTSPLGHPLRHSISLSPISNSVIPIQFYTTMNTRSIGLVARSASSFLSSPATRRSIIVSPFSLTHRQPCSFTAPSSPSPSPSSFIQLRQQPLSTNSTIIRQSSSSPFTSIVAKESLANAVQQRVRNVATESAQVEQRAPVCILLFKLGFE